LRIKPKGRKQSDMFEIFSEIISLIGQVKQRYEMYRISDFMNFLDQYGYDLDRLGNAVKPILKAYEKDGALIRNAKESES
jgi:hypothetical protein